MKKEDIPPPAYDLHMIKSSTAELTSNEITQSKEVLREKNAVREGKLSTSDLDAFLHIVKSSLGSGFLAMPDAVHNIGLVGGFFGTAIVAFVCAHCVDLLVRCSQELCYRENRCAMTYTETVERTFEVGGGGKFKRWSALMRYASNFFMFVTYFGVTTAYVIFVSSTIKTILEAHTDFSMNLRFYILLLTILLLPVGIVRHIKFLVPFSALANICLLVGCTLTLYLCCIDLPPLSSRPMVVDFTRWPLFFSTAIFAMEGIGTVMPVENSMRNPGHFLGCPGVLNLSMFVVAAIYVVVGSIGYIKYGNDVLGSVTLNLPNDPLSETVKALVAVAIFFTYPLQLTACMEVIWSIFSSRFSEKNQDTGYYFTRVILILCTVLMAVCLPALGPVISLVGAIGFSGLGLLLPTLTEMVLFWDTIGAFLLTKHVILILFWAFATVFGSITSINEIIKEFHIQS